MGDNAKLTFTLQGISEHNGKIDIIDSAEENVDAIMAFTFKEKDDKAFTLRMTAIGGFSIRYYSEIIQNMIQIMGRDRFTKALMLAELTSKLEKEHCGGD